MSIQKKPFGTMPDGREVPLFLLENKTGLRLEAIPYGCRIVRLLAPDRDGRAGDVILGYDRLEDYLSHTNFHGAVVGRYANRIAGARFSLDGTEYLLTKNEGRNQLHGGNGFSQKVWDAEEFSDGEEPSVVFRYRSADGEEGFPGNLEVRVRYTLTPKNELKISYRAVSDKKTIVNLTNHAFFNLGGFDSGDVLGTELQICADRYTPTDRELIPTGELLPVRGTPLDFTASKPIGRDIGASSCLMDMIGGFDHNFALNRRGSGLEKAALAWDPKSGRGLEILTDLPGVQLYTANSFGEDYGKKGVRMEPHHAFCLETQLFPDSIHHPAFRSPVLEPGTAFRTETVYRFFAK